jgi:hypothetical protein
VYVPSVARFGFFFSGLVVFLAMVVITCNTVWIRLPE